MVKKILKMWALLSVGKSSLNLSTTQLYHKYQHCFSFFVERGQGLDIFPQHNGTGSYAEYMLSPLTNVFGLPDNSSYKEGAA